MKTYTVTITGNQKHINGDVYENQTKSQGFEIINKFHDTDYPAPQLDGNNWELNCDKNICIKEN